MSPAHDPHIGFGSCEHAVYLPWMDVQGLAPPEAVLSAAGQLAELLVWLGHEADAVVLQRALGEWLEAYAVGGWVGGWVGGAAATESLSQHHHPMQV